MGISSSQARLVRSAKLDVGLVSLIALRAISNTQRGTILLDWLVHDVGLTSDEVRDLGHRLARDADIMEESTVR